MQLLMCIDCGLCGGGGGGVGKKTKSVYFPFTMCETYTPIKVQRKVGSTEPLSIRNETLLAFIFELHLFYWVEESKKYEKSKKKKKT